MQIQKGFQCCSCNSFLSHPIDACPVCGDQFYWLVLTSGEVGERARKQFVTAMLHLVEERVTEEFLTHGGQLWLPYKFWDHCPDGDALHEFPWIEDLELFQHDGNPAEPEPEALPEAAVAEPTAWDTIPKMALPDFSKMQQQPASAEAADKAVEAPVLGAEAEQSPAARSKPEKEPAPVQSKAAKKPAARPVAQKSWFGRFQFSELLGPLMVFLFFVFLSLSYLVLRYHKNQMAPLPLAPAEEVNDERPVLR